jgi:hypothetical protein
MAKPTPIPFILPPGVVRNAKGELHFSDGTLLIVPAGTPIIGTPGAAAADPRGPAPLPGKTPGVSPAPFSPRPPIVGHAAAPPLAGRRPGKRAGAGGGSRVAGAGSGELLARDYPGRGAPPNPARRDPPGLDDPKRTDLSGDKGIASFIYSIVGAATCSGTFTAKCTFVTAAHCFDSDRKGPFEVALLSRQFGKNPKDRAQVNATVELSPGWKEHATGAVHDFAVVRIHDRDCAAAPLIPKARVIPLCAVDSLEPDLEVTVPSQRTGTVYPAVIDREEKDDQGRDKIFYYNWKAIGKDNLAVQILTRQGGIIGGDSGSPVIAHSGKPNACIGGVLHLGFDGAEVNLSQYLAFSKANTWAHQAVQEMSGGPSGARVISRADTGTPHQAFSWPSGVTAESGPIVHN